MGIETALIASAIVGATASVGSAAISSHRQKKNQEAMEDLAARQKQERAQARQTAAERKKRVEARRAAQAGRASSRKAGTVSEGGGGYRSTIGMDGAIGG